MCNPSVHDHLQVECSGRHIAESAGLVFGVPVRYVTGWQANAKGDPLKPFSRGPGTMPPRFLSLTVATRPDPKLFPPAATSGPDGPHAVLEDSGADVKPGVALVCYGG